MPQQHSEMNTSNKYQVQLALTALEQDPQLSERRAAAIYTVVHAVTHDPACRTRSPKQRNILNTITQRRDDFRRCA
jgi:hypothetical protein